MAYIIDNEKGSALVLVLFFILTFTVIGIGVMVSSTTNSTMSRNFEVVTQAKHLSDIGLKIALREFINSGFLRTTHTEDMAAVQSENNRLTTDVEYITTDEYGDYVWSWDENSEYDPLVDLAEKSHGFSFRVYYSSASNFVIESDGWYGSVHQVSKARGRVESMFEFSYMSADDLGDFADGSDQEIRGKVHANGDMYVRPAGSDLTINPLYFTSAGNIIRSRDAWGRPDDAGYGNIEIARKRQDSGDWITMDPGNPRGEEGMAFDSYHTDWNSRTDGVQAKWGGIVRDRVSRKYFPPITNLLEGGSYDLAAQDGGLIIDNTSHYQPWCTQISSYYNTVEDRTQTLWEIDIQALSDEGDWPGNGLMYCTVPVRLVNAASLEDKLMVASCRNVYTSGSFNIGVSEGGGGITGVGSLNINPSSSENNRFIMETPSGEIDLDTLDDEGSTYTYEGPSSEVNVKVKAQGRTLTINGEDIELPTNERQKITGSMYVVVHNTHSGEKWNKAKGHWWIDINGSNLEFDPEMDLEEVVEVVEGDIQSAAIMTTQRIYHLPGVIVEEVPVEEDDDTGLIGGHIDVDTSSFIAPIGSGSTDGHIHEYDNKYSVIGTDYFDMLDSKLHNITEDISDGSTKFKIIVTNADLSPGGRLVINQDYDSGDSGSYTPVATYDDTNIADLPIYSLDGVPGTTQLEKFGMYFDINAIAAGNVLPTNTGDVKKNVPGKFGEWRNGALTIQAVMVNADDTDNFTTDITLSNGGVQGTARSGLLWENTIFWHWHGPSYHEPDWDAPIAGAPDDGEDDGVGGDVASGFQIHAALVDGAPAVDEYNWVDRDGDHRYDYDNSVIYDDWDAKDSYSFNEPYSSGNPGANTSNLLEDWTGMTLTITGSIIHLGSNYVHMAENLDNSGITDDQIAWVRQSNSGSGTRNVIYNPDLATSEGEPPFTPRIGQITNWGR
ncbi:hypothetical protein ACFL60_02390 [Candidatus Omnitrophota bacterium]